MTTLQEQVNRMDEAVQENRLLKDMVRDLGIDPACAKELHYYKKNVRIKEFADAMGINIANIDVCKNTDGSETYFQIHNPKIRGNIVDFIGRNIGMKLPETLECLRNYMKTRPSNAVIAATPSPPAANCSNNATPEQNVNYHFGLSKSKMRR
jgi:hypothetical protein